jgi:hypothetical protein
MPAARFWADTVAKVENRAIPKISRMSIFNSLRRRIALQDRYGWSQAKEGRRALPARRFAFIS